MRIYVASSWRNRRIDEVIPALRADGHEVYDFREDDAAGAAFNWRDIDPDWQHWTPMQFRANLMHPIAREGFQRDMSALEQAEGLLLVLPCGRSAHLELGYAIGARKPTAILLAEGQEPELMYSAVDKLCLDLEEVIWRFRAWEEGRGRLFRIEGGTISKERPS